MNSDNPYNCDETSSAYEGSARVPSAPVQHPQLVEIPKPLEVHPSVSPLAAELLMKVTEQLHNEPKSYNQLHATRGACGTPCCIIGWMEAFAGKSDMSGKVTGLTRNQYDSIFNFHSGWPKKFDTGQRVSQVPASVAIARIDHFLRTGQ